MSKRTLTKNNVWDFYERLPDVRAQCKTCQKEYCYINDYHFKEHLNKKDRTKLEKRINYFLTESPEIYFVESEQKCIICQFRIERQNFKNHLSNMHSVESVISHEINENTKNYYEFISQKDCFAVKCILCEEPYSLGLHQTMRNHTVTCEPLKNTQDISSIITNEDILWEHYTKSAIDFRAKCKQCNNFQHNYINIDIIKDFNKHLRNNHHEIISFEEGRERRSPWIFFMLRNNAELTFKCLVCENTVSLTTLTDLPNCENIMNNHLDNGCLSDDFRNPYYYNCDWKWKYLKRIGKKNFKIKCQALKNFVECKFEMFLEFNFSPFDYHIQNEHPADKVKSSGSQPKKRREGSALPHHPLIDHSELLTYTQETDDDAGSTERNLSDAISIPSIITNETILRQHYTKVAAIDFQLKCNYCNNFRDHYINITNFNEHLTAEHKNIVLFEKRIGRRSPWIFFMFYDYTELILQCLICINKIRLTTLTDTRDCENIMNEHLNTGCYPAHLRNPDRYNCDYVWKYCEKIGKKNYKIKCKVFENNVECQFKMPIVLQLLSFNYHILNIHLDKVEPSGSSPKKRKEGNSSKDKD